LVTLWLFCWLGTWNGRLSPDCLYNVNTDTSSFAKQLYQDREGLTVGFMSFCHGSSHLLNWWYYLVVGWTAGRCVMTGTDIDPLGDSPYSVGVHQEENWQRLNHR
jgi:hypothetical protein